MGMCLLFSLQSLGWIHTQEPQVGHVGWALSQRDRTNPVFSGGSQEPNLAVGWWDLNSGITLPMH